MVVLDDADLFQVRRSPRINLTASRVAEAPPASLPFSDETRLWTVRPRGAYPLDFSYFNYE